MSVQRVYAHAMFFASRASCVRLVYRGSDLSDSMSHYLLERLRRAANVRIETRSQVVELSGDDRLRSIKIRDGEGRVVERAVGGLFVMIGADPWCGAGLRSGAYGQRRAKLHSQQTVRGHRVSATGLRSGLR
jgi:thioredoxin reductase